ncbi:GntR family transcriptional regulator [Jeongeupia naejangsanensis]|nr:GntR family transcriptional regulator [Jeongeupia naejangsanensis]
MRKLTVQPLYRQVMREVLTSVEAGAWREDEALPSEIELGERFGVSQGTVRKALDALVADGLLYRRQGVGTFVEGVNDFLARGRFTGLSGEGAEVPRFELLGCVKIHAGEQLAEILGLRRGAALWQIRRHVRVAGELVGIEEMLLPEAGFPELDVRRIRELRGDVRELCWRDFGVRLKDAEVRYKAMPASQAEARLLHCELNEALLQVVRLAKDYEGRPQMWSVVWMKTERWAFEPPALLQA